MAKFLRKHLLKETVITRNNKSGFIYFKTKVKCVLFKSNKFYFCASEKSTVRWCNGNTPDFDSVIQGSSPCRTTIKNPFTLFSKGFFFKPLNAHKRRINI
jgi:hypothetical protein